MKKQELNLILKKCGLGFVKGTLNSFETKVLTNFDGKRNKGIKGGSIGPMTMTNAHTNHNLNIERKVIDSIGTQYLKEHSPNNYLSFDINGLKITLIWKLFPTYAHNHYDASYMTYWLTI